MLSITSSNSNTNQFRETIFIFLLVLFSLNFFSATFAHDGIFKLCSYAFLVGGICLSLPWSFPKTGGIILPVQIICASILLSVLMAYLSWEQDFSYGISTLPYLTWITFFYLHHIKYPVKKIENIVLVYGIIYTALYTFQFLHNDTVYFGYKDEFIEDRGIIRIDFPGGGILYLSYFICLTRAFSNSKVHAPFILALLVGIIVIILQVTRQCIAATFMITLYHILKFVSFGKKIILITMVAALMTLFFASKNSISQGLKQQQKETSSEGSQYIRVLAGSFFLDDFSPNTMSKIFGNGLPNINSEYGKYTVYLQDIYGFHISDVGLIGLYAMFGILPVLAFLFIVFKGLTMTIPFKYYYVKYYLIFLLVTSLTSDYSYSWNYLFTTVFILYVLQEVYDDKCKFLKSSL